MKRKTSLIRTLCNRAHKICLVELFADEMKHIKLTKIKNCYPKELVNKIVNIHFRNQTK